MPALGSGRDASWSLPRRRARFRIRRDRSAAGPPRNARRRQSGSWLSSFSIFAAAVLATTVIVASLSGGRTARPAEEAETESRPAAGAAAGPIQAGAAAKLGSR